MVYLGDIWECLTVSSPVHPRSILGKPTVFESLTVSTCEEHFKSESAFYWPQLETEDTADAQKT